MPSRSLFIETERLFLFHPVKEDLEDLCLLQADEQVMRYIGRGVRSRQEVETGLEKAILHFQKFSFSLGSVFEKSTQKFIGRAGLIHLAMDENSPEIEVGYALMPEFWGKGYATELAAALVRWGFKNLAVPEIVAVTREENLGSQRVLKKIGMSFVKSVEYNGLPVVFFSVRA